MSGEVKDQSKGLGSKAKRPEPEGREEPRPGSAGTGRVWKKPLGVKPQQGKVTSNINILSAPMHLHEFLDVQDQLKC